MLMEISDKAMAPLCESEFQQACLKIMGTTLDVSRVYAFEHLHQNDTMRNICEWVNSGIEPLQQTFQNIAADDVPWWTDQMKHNETISFESIEDMPSGKEKVLMQEHQVKSHLLLPLNVAGKYYGFVGFDECRRYRSWHGDLNLLLASTRIMAGVMERKRSRNIECTDRQKAERDLVDSEQKYRQLFEMESDSIFLIDNETGKLLEVNAACESLYGYSRDQLHQMKNTDLSAEPDQTRKATVSALDKVPVRYHRKKDGTVFPVEITARHFLWQGRGVHIAAIRDITERIAAERQKDELEAQLRHAQKMESLGTLAGGIAHDFNNILSAIMGYTELAALEKAGSKTLRTLLQEVLQASYRAKSLVAQILAFSRQAKSEFGPVQIRLIIKETVKMLRVTSPAAVRIETDIASEGLVMADANQIQQVVMNLCTNAFHAMKTSGGCLRITLKETFLDNPAANDDLTTGPYLELQISDTGVGMDQTTMQRAFEPFFTTKEKGEGTGLGLSVVYGIVKSHKGTIGVKSEPAKGTSFSVYLPMLEGRARGPVVQDDVLSLRGRERILYVDDEPALVKISQAMLTPYGYQVTTRANALEALELFKQNPHGFDLVMTDLNMSPLSGYFLAKQISEIRPEVPIILVTGFSDQLSEQDLSAVGIRAVALKPLLKVDLLKLIRDVVDKQISNCQMM